MKDTVAALASNVTITTNKLNRNGTLLTLVPACRVDRRDPVWLSDSPQWPPARDPSPERRIRRLSRSTHSSGFSGWTLRLPETNQMQTLQLMTHISLSHHFLILFYLSHLWLIGKLLLDHSFKAPFDSFDSLFEDVVVRVHQRHRVASWCSNLPEKKVVQDD